MEKILIVFYSRSGNTKKISLALQSALNADIEEVREKKSRDGFFAYIGAALDVVFGREAEIATPVNNPNEYDIVIIGTPVWAAKPVPAIQSYVKKHLSDISSVAFFCTMGGSGSDKTFAYLEKLVGCRPITKMALTEEHIKSGGYRVPLEEFVQHVKQTGSQTNA